MRSRAAAALLAAAALAAAGASRSTPPPPGPRPVVFADVTAASGVSFRHENGARGKKLLPETMGPGVALFDFDGDGRLDLFFVNGKPFRREARRATPALYRNRGDGTFEDVTAKAGLAVELYGLGAAAADVDNDGDADLFVSGLGGNRLFRNGGGRFTDATARSGLAGDAASFGTSAAFFDFDNDGRLDLFLARYVAWTEATDLFCTLDGKTKSYCTPESYKGESPVLWKGRGDGTFEDVTKKAGLFDPASKGLGVALLDVDADGFLDLAVANDTQPNRLYRNRGNGTFEEIGVAAGIGFSETGAARAGMGIDAADWAEDGRAGLAIGNFSNEMMSLYRDEGRGLFVDDAAASGVGRASFLTLAFATFFFDFDLDSRLDLFAANGHVADDVERVQKKVTWAQPPHLFRNLGGRKFEDVAPRSGAVFASPRVARGAAYGDLDADGDLDLVVTTNGGPAFVFRNGEGNANGWLTVKTRGTKSNRDGIGAKVTVTFPGGRKLWRLVHTGSSYLSQSQLALTFGLGAAPRVESVEVAWPSGTVDRLGPVDARRTIEVVEGKGLAGRAPR